MNIKKIARLLNGIGKPMIATNTSLKPDVDYGINYYKLRLNKDNNKWELLYCPHERRSSGGEEVEKSFNDEASASKYYYLFQINSHFYEKYIRRFNHNNKNLNIGSPNFRFEDLKEAFRRLNIEKKYYSFNGKVKERSIFLEKVNNEKSKVYFIGLDGKEVIVTLPLEHWEAYFAMYRLVYYLYLFDQHYADLIKSKEIGHIFTDEDYKTVLTGR